MNQETRSRTRLGSAAALTALVGAMLGTAAFAQYGGPPPGPPPGGPPFGAHRFGGPPPGGGMGPGMRGPRPSTAANAPLSALSAGLKLTAAQQARIAKIQAQFADQRRNLLPPPGSGPPPAPEAMRAAMDRMRGLDRTADVGIASVLTGPQKAALPALLRTLDDLRLAGIPPATYGALKLTASQTARITGLARTAQQAMRGAMDSARQSGDFGAARQSMRGGRERLASQTAAILTPTQRGIVDKYKASHPRPPFGGPGGFGPPPPGERRSQVEGHGRPVAPVAQELGVTPEQFRAAFRKVHPAGAGQEPTEAQRRANLTAVSSRRLDAGPFCSSFNFSWTALAYPLPRWECVWGICPHE
jgi:hypothetical protein